MAKKNNIPTDNNIVKVPFEEVMPDNYLPYAVEVAKDRALPDVRDGLKPVQRRILYGSYMLKAFPDRPYYKSARLVGDILGKYHPHGDASVYDAMVLLAQDFTTRMPLIDGHGNWGSIDGDSAAAMRYTEARLTNISMELLADIDKEVVQMVGNYSETELEPKVLPAKYPNLLVNGSFGIAVGLATNIPPHNLNEIIDGTIAYIDNNNITTLELMEYIKGPDLPTGGTLIGVKSLQSAYETGEGKVTLRAKTSIEKLENGRLGIVITEFPFRRNKAKLLQQISEMTGDKRHAKALDPITDIRDESDRTGIRAVIEFRKNVEEDIVNKVLLYLYKKTDLQCNINFNMVAIANGKPETLGLKQVLVYYVNHRKEVITTRTIKDLEIAKKRYHIVEGFIKAIKIMDAIIEEIRASKSKKDARINLMNRFGFTEIQADAILELMLYRLTGLEIEAFQKEHKELAKTIAKLEKILSSEKELLKVVKAELLEVSEKYKTERRTGLIEDENEAKIDVEDIIVVEDTMITMSNEGFIKRIPMKSYTRTNMNVDEIEYREGDFNKFCIKSNTIDTVMLFTDKGNMYQTKGINLPEGRWKEKGERIDKIIKGIDLNNENIIYIYSTKEIDENSSFIFFTNKGGIKKVNKTKYSTNYSKVSAIKLKDDERLVKISICEEFKEYIEITRESGLTTVYKINDLQDSERTTGCMTFTTNLTKDTITNIDYVDSRVDKKYNIYINEIGQISSSKVNRKYNSIKINTNNNEKLFIFTENAMMHIIEANYFENINENTILLSNILDQYNNDKIINVISLKDLTEDTCIYLFTSKGYIKKSSLIELSNGAYSTSICKFKTEKDKLVSAETSLNSDEVVIITKRGAAIRFEGSPLTLLGRNASGVIGITLREDDEVILGKIIDKDKIDKALVKIKTKDGDENTAYLNTVKLQNRAGRGSSIIVVGINNYIAKIDYKED